MKASKSNIIPFLIHRVKLKDGTWGLPPVPSAPVSNSPCGVESCESSISFCMPSGF